MKNSPAIDTAEFLLFSAWALDISSMEIVKAMKTQSMLVVLSRNTFLRGNLVNNKAAMVPFIKAQHCHATKSLISYRKYRPTEPTQLTVDPGRNTCKGEAHDTQDFVHIVRQ
jgi:hypothetical protein